MQVSDKLIKPVMEVKYLNADNADRYRCIMRIFFENYEKLKYRLYQEDVYEEMLKDSFFADYRPEQCLQDLTMLTEWGNLNPIQDTRKVASIAEFKNRKYRYQMSEYSVEIERLIIRLENLYIYSSTPAGKQPDEIFRIVKCGANEELSNWKRTLWLAAEIYNSLPCRNGKRMYLAVFAAMLIGNPHAFDRGTKEGELLYRVILKDLELREIEVGTSGMFPAYKRQRSYLAAGIMLDDISNYAMLYNVRAIKNDGMPHKGMEGFSAESDIVQVPLNVVAEWKEILCPNGKIHIVENPSVFAVLCENNDMSHEDGTGVSYVPHGDRVGADDTVHYEGARTNDVGKAYMCMNGQPRLAGLMVLDLLAKSGTEVYYSGDLDPESILIAQKLSQYYEGKFNFKHMGEEDYEKCKSEKRISPKRLKMLGKITDERLRPVAERIAKCEMAGYQEKLIEM